MVSELAGLFTGKENHRCQMVDVMRIVVPAVPVPQPRQKHRAFKTKSGAVRTHNYTPTRDPVNVYKATVKAALEKVYKDAPIDEPLIVNLLFVMPRPATKPAWIKKQSRWEQAWKSGQRVPCAAKGRNDRDNLMKSTQDALNELLFTDDGLIWSGTTDKLHAGSSEQPHVEIVVTWGEL